MFRLFLRACAGFALFWAGSALAASEPVDSSDTYVITATRGLRLKSDAPVRTELVEKGRIESSGARSLADAVEFSTGVRVENDCQNCNFSQLRLLGLEGGFTSILTNGQPLMSALAGVYGIEQIPASMIERIEIVKGGASALYGPNSIAGVVNIITKDPVKTGGFLSHSVSSFQGRPDRSSSAGLDLAAASGKAGLSLYGQGDFIQAHDVDGDGYSEVSLRDFSALGGRAVFRPGPGYRVSAEYGHAYEYRRGGNALDSPVTRAEIAEAVQSASDSGNIGFEGKPASWLEFRLAAAASRSRRESYYGAGMDPDAFGSAESPVNVLDAQFTHDLAILGRSIVSWGLQYCEEGISDAQPAYGRRISQLESDAGLWLQYDWWPTYDFELVLGGRLDQSNLLPAAVFSPRLSARYRAAPGATLRASYAQGFRSPKVFNEDLAVEAAGGNVQLVSNDPALKEERSESYMLGLEYKPSWRHYVEINGFYTGLSGAFFTENSDDPSTPDQVEFTRRNFGSSRVYGAEFNYGLDFGGLKAGLGYVEQRSVRDEADPDFGSRNFARTPERYGVATLDWDGKFGELFIGCKYTGPMEVPHYAGYIATDELAVSPSFFVLDLAVTEALPLSKAFETTLRLGVKNLGDAYQQDLDRGPQRDSGYVYGPRFPQTLYTTLKLGF